MASLEYMQGRKRYRRPQAMLWADNPGTVVEDTDSESPTFGQFFHVPLGNEIGSRNYDPSDTNEFLIISDHNRQEISFQNERIETKQRTVNGRMRTYHIADKLSVGTSWDMLPSRSYSSYADFNAVGDSPQKGLINQEFTADGGAGGADLLDWYERYTGSFWLYLSYDKNTNFVDLSDKDAQYNNLNKYSQVIEVFFGDFQYSVIKRGGTNFDFWDIEVTLEEV